jgi:hypothetical protein
MLLYRYTFSLSLSLAKCDCFPFIYKTVLVLGMTVHFLAALISAHTNFIINTMAMELAVQFSDSDF